MKPRFLLALLAGLAFSPMALADLYGFVDEDGHVFLADHQVDSRYQLFRKGNGPAAAPLELNTLNRPEGKAVAGRGLAAAIRAPSANPRLKASFSRLIAQTAREHKLDEDLLHAIVNVESGYNAQALSPKGAVGLMQVMPATAERFGVTNLNDPRQNLKAGARYLRFLLSQFGNDLPRVLAAYNAGEGAVQKYGKTLPPYRETRDYVAKVMASYGQPYAGPGTSGLEKTVGRKKPGGRVSFTISPDAL